MRINAVLGKCALQLLVLVLTASPPMGAAAQAQAAEAEPVSRKVVSVDSASAGFHVLALLDDGTVRAWGSNMTGQLGFGGAGMEPYNAGMPVYERDGGGGLTLLSDVAAVAAGAQFSLALKKDGTVWSWGMNWSKELGRDTPSWMDPVAGPVTGLPKIKQIAAGDTHSLALAEDGTVWAWGDNQTGAAGIGSTSPDFIPNPVQVRRADGQMLADIDYVSAGMLFSVAVTTDGHVLSWGYNGNRQLGIGDNTNTPRPSPQPVKTGAAEPLTGVERVAAGSYHTLALKSDGSVWSWGSNAWGQLGSGDTATALYARPVMAESGVAFGGVGSIEAGGAHSIAVREDGTIWTWGNNDRRQLGRATGASFSTFPGLTEETEDGSSLGGIESVSGGFGHTTVLTRDGTVWSVGANDFRQLGGGRTDGLRPQLSRTTMTWPTKAFWTSAPTAQATAGQPSDVTLQLADHEGRPAPYGVDRVTMETDSGTIGPVVYKGDGRFAASFVSTVPGLARIEAKVNGLDVPARLDVSIGSGPPDPVRSAFEASPGAARAGADTVTVTVYAKDAFGNSANVPPGDASFAATLGTVEPVPAPACGEGCYRATLRSEATGISSVTFSVNGAPLVAGSVVFLAGDPDYGRSTLTADRSVLPTDGTAAAAIVLTLKDANGNGLTESGGPVTIATDRGRLTTVTESAYGVYETKLEAAPEAGTATIRAERNGALLAAPIAVRFVEAVSAVEIGAPLYELRVGGTAQASALARYWDGATGDVTARSGWTVRDAAVAGVDANGVVTGRSPGTTVLTATYAGRAATAAIKVSPGATAGGDDGSGGTDPEPPQPGGPQPGPIGGGTGAPGAEKPPSPKPAHEPEAGPGPGPPRPADEPPAPPFADVAGHWAAEAIRQAAAARIADGYPDGTFRPDAKVTRAEFVVLLARAIGLSGAGASSEPAAGETWPDWAFATIGRAMAAGLSDGYEDGTFRPAASVTRAEMAVWLHRALVHAGRGASGSLDGGDPAGAYADAADVPAWALDAFRAAIGAGLLVGDERGRLRPADAVTRAEAVTVLLRLIGQL
ncbi:invasin domain 3-containing protein [Paenibacillus flagellatus]|uniref:S-layer protein n=1 Tax=Paenibacillus flagellatus TaxID=2211139 RepID=A0A2V5K9M0_9BACL|nr:invasin domain 3-containing protein [Paenibacillus flagellatus]PYI56209.1 S-layer protein [Paenibacillus flagellatus]